MPIIDSGTVTVFDRRATSAALESRPRDIGESSAAGAASDPGFAEVAAQVAIDTSRTAAKKVAAPVKSFKFWENDSLGFGDVIDIVNPLQHLPIVSTFYRNLTGDQLGAAPRVIGGALWGRVGGLIAGAVNSIVEWFTGKDVGDHLYAALFGPPKGAPAALAAKAPTGQEKVAAPVTAIVEDTLMIANFPAELVPVAERAITESTLQSSEESPSAVPEATESKEVPVIDETPWSAASALHIFQTHDRALKRDEDVPVLHYIA